MNSRWKKSLSTLACTLIAAAPMQTFAATEAAAPGPVKHVLLISIDGLHALDLTNWVTQNPESNIGTLARHGIRYTNAQTSQPSDSYPGLAALVTGGSPITTGFWYDVTYNRYLAPPTETTPYGIVGSPNACKDGVQGTQVGFDEEIDYNYQALDGGGAINPKYLPRDPGKGCAPVYPHDYLRVNTIFEVARKHGLYTAWIDKHPAYEWTKGPSGQGVSDFWAPEINSIPVPLPSVDGCSPLPDPANATPSNAWTDSLLNIQCYDTYKVNGVLHEIDGFSHTGKTTTEVPAIFGMNFQALSVGEKSKAGGYSDVLGTPSAALLGEMKYVDSEIGRMVNEIKARGLDDSTLIIIAAKHGQSPIDRTRLTDIDPSLPATIIGSAYAYDISDDGSLIWLQSPELVDDVVANLSTPANQKALGIQEIFAGASLSEKFNVPGRDDRTPDIILKTNTGVIFTGGSKIAEHGGLNEDDTHVGLLVSFPSFKAQVVKTTVSNQQVAPTILKALGLNPFELQAVQKEQIQPLPFLF